MIAASVERPARTITASSTGAWVGVPKGAPRGWALCVVSSRDSMAGLEAELKAAGSDVTAQDIAAANGVPWPGQKTCEWGRNVAAWHIATGGGRNPVVPSQPNNCEPGKGFTHFGDGARVYLPDGLRARAPGASPPAPAPSSSSSSDGLLLFAAVLGGVGGAIAREQTFLRHYPRALCIGAGAAALPILVSVFRKD